MKYKIMIYTAILTIVSCSSKQKIDKKYELIIMTVDSLVNEAKNDSIGLKKTTLNTYLSEEIILNPGFSYYNNGKAVNECSENNIADSTFSKFNYEKFKTEITLLDTNKITNTKVITDLSLKRKVNKDKLTSYTSSNPNVKKENISDYLWRNERKHHLHEISTPIFSNDHKTAVIFVSTLENGTRSWTLKKNENNTWTIFCVEQITVE